MKSAVSSNVVDLTKVICGDTDKILKSMTRDESVADTIERLYQKKSSLYKLKLVESVLDKMLEAKKEIQ